MNDKKSEQSDVIKVKIGNDIGLNVTLEDVSEYNQTNIKQIKCFIVKADNKKRHYTDADCAFDAICDPATKVMDFDGLWYSIGELDPYQIDAPGIHWPLHEPDEYHFDICGAHGYHFRPWNYRYQHPRERWYLFDYRLRHKCPIPHHYGEFVGRLEDRPILKKDPAYLAPCRILQQRDKIQAYFPASQQFSCGIYNIIVEYTLYEPGWGPKDLRRRVIEYDDAFELVDDSTDANGSVIIDLSDPKDPSSYKVVKELSTSSTKENS